MNIFALQRSPIESALEMIDKHVVKMPTETCQMLHTNELFYAFVDLYGFEPSLKELKQFHKDRNSNLMKPAMLNHPSTIWARASPENTKWLWMHGMALCCEYSYRYDNKEHGSYKRIQQLDSDHYTTECLKSNHSKATPISIAMDNQYRIENTFDDEWEFVIQSYRHYYLEGKWRFAEWKRNRRPEWFPANWYAKKYNEGVRAYNATNPKYPQTLLSEEIQ
jgi:hypothetical protein